MIPVISYSGVLVPGNTGNAMQVFLLMAWEQKVLQKWQQKSLTGLWFCLFVPPRPPSPLNAFVGGEGGRGIFCNVNTPVSFSETAQEMQF